MPGGEVAAFVGDDEPQGLGIACRAADLEQVGVDDDEAAEAVPRGEGVDLAVAQEHIGVGDAPQPEALGGLHHHPVALGELGRAHLHRGGAHLRVQERTRAPEDQRQQRDGQEDLGARRRAVADEEVAHVPGKSSGGGHGNEPHHQRRPGRDRHDADSRTRPHQRHLGAVAKPADTGRTVDGGAVERTGARGPDRLCGQ